MKNNFLFLIVILSFITSCTSYKAIGDGVAKDIKVKKLIENTLDKKVKFKNLSIQSKINANIDGNSTSLNSTIYIENENKIWVNLTKFGINGGRALITPDGFKAYERIGKTYIDGDYSYVNNLLSVDFIDYDKLQNLLLGRLFIELNSNDFNIKIEEEQYVLTYNKNEDLLNNPEEGEYIQTYIFAPNFHLKKAYLSEPYKKMDLEIEYDNWVKIGGEEFPKNVKVVVKGKKTQEVELEYNNFTFEKMNTPFNIPSGFKERELK